MMVPGPLWRPRLAQWWRLAALVLVATVIVWWSVVNGRALQRDEWGVKLGAAPLVGRDEYDGWDWRFSGWLVAAAALVVAAAVSAWRGWWHRASLAVVFAASAVGAAAFGVVLALTDGTDGLLFGAEHPTEYWANLSEIPSADDFVRDFTEKINRYSVHVRGHPPGFVLVLKMLAWIGLDSVWFVVGLSILGAGVTVAAVLWTLRSVADDVWCRNAAPFLMTAPYAIWMITSADAVFTAVAALGVGCTAHALRRSSGWRQHVLAAAGGVLLGWLLMFTYLGATFMVVPAVVIVAGLVARRWRRSAAVAGVAVIGLAVVVAGFALAGFWWLDGVEATKDEYYKGSAKFRPYGYFWIGNMGAALFALGPIVVVALGRLVRRPVWWLVGAACVGITASNLSGYTKAEVERIWLLFYPWVTVAAGAMWSANRRWLAPVAIAVHGASAIVLQAALVTKW
jgi:methylthioxylose transferase